MRTALIAMMVLILTGVYSQELYRDSIYKKVMQNTHEFGPIEGEMLKLDFFRAKDAKGKLPLVVYVHGGGFSAGAYDSGGIVSFARRMAKRGYAVASIQYRLTMKDIGFGCDVPVEMKKEAIVNASHDIMDGVKHILDYNETFEIDSEKVILIGSSAGAETVLNLAYMFNYQEIIKDFRFAGVISLAGAILDLNAITSENALPTQLFHGTGDAFLPYETGPHHYCSGNDPGFMMLYGAGPIARRLKGLGVSYYLYSITGGSHGWSGTPVNRCFTEIVDFIYNDIINPRTLRQTERTISDY